MTGGRYELAQVNIARLLAPLDDPLLADFVANLDPVNAVADAAEGFVWRLKTEDNNATAIRVFDDDWLIVNMSVWKSVETLVAYVYGPEHRAVLRRRREWFARLDEASTALWWVPAGHRPTVREAEERLLHLREHGPTPYAFTLRETFPPPGEPFTGPQHRDFAGCEAE
ncbi:DUF3291 domain-containing protein [Carbonactinospora thermoautotrophica]|uniref:DUF3291 domain-containing protein n=1 Tax=Carbonactinospora thermoautotrophica TaxID=1469144 RepID=UPI00226E7DCF|nr:DUF3291 domain-containing protein [Carbonactinospora thermoautotrophica]MCX9191424.1 DUF3291 domain-containing protein [Carbonactinospora thermoautotrophica]